MNYKVDTYRDGGTVSVKSEKDNAEYCINKMMDSGSEGEVYACYPTEGLPIAGLPELNKALRILSGAVGSCRSNNEIIMTGKGLEWIYGEIEEIERQEQIAKIKEELDIQPCPFCGGDADIMSKIPPTIRCNKCSTEMVVGISSTIGMTVRIWNSRFGEEKNDE